MDLKFLILVFVGVIAIVLGVRGTYKDVWQSLTGGIAASSSVAATAGTQTPQDPSRGASASNTFVPLGSGLLALNTSSNRAG